MIVAMGLQAIIKAPILLAWAVVKIAGKQWQWSLATAAAVLVIMAVLMVAVVLALPKFKIVQQLTDNLNRVTREKQSTMERTRYISARRILRNSTFSR